MTLYRGVYPLAFKIEHTDHAALNKEVIDELQRRGVVHDGDIVIITKGDLEKPGGTNAMKLVRVGEMVVPGDQGSCE
jgi:pyruvate kinase